MYFHYKSMVENGMPGVWPVWTQWHRVGRIYKEEYYTLLHTKYESSGPCGIGEEVFFYYVFPIVSPWELLATRGCKTMADDDAPGARPV